MTQRKLSSRYYSKKQENSIAETIGGKTTPNSGARPYQKGDVSTKGHDENSWLIEAKTCMTSKQSFAIKKQWLETIKEEAFQAGKMNYALAFSFGPNQPNYYILSEDKFKQLFGSEE